MAYTSRTPICAAARARVEAIREAMVRLKEQDESEASATTASPRIRPSAPPMAHRSRAHRFTVKLEHGTGVTAQAYSLATANGDAADVIRLTAASGYLAEQVLYGDRSEFVCAWDSSSGRKLTEAQVARRCVLRLRRAASQRPGGIAARLMREQRVGLRMLRTVPPRRRGPRSVQRPRAARRVARPIRGRARAPDPDPAPSAQSVRVGPTSGVPS